MQRVGRLVAIGVGRAAASGAPARPARRRDRVQALVARLVDREAVGQHPQHAPARRAEPVGQACGSKAARDRAGNAAPAAARASRERRQQHARQHHEQQQGGRVQVDPARAAGRRAACGETQRLDVGQREALQRKDGTAPARTAPTGSDAPGAASRKVLSQPAAYWVSRPRAYSDRMAPSAKAAAQVHRAARRAARSAAASVAPIRP